MKNSGRKTIAIAKNCDMLHYSKQNDDLQIRDELSLRFLPGGWGPWSDNSAMIQTTAPEIEIPKPPDVVLSTTKKC